tara:strand:+ start:1395 stop:1919 length:525 start_codon:yes stop_codon:yes gene_type:complete
MNLIKLLGNLARDNTKFSLYDQNPELYDDLGEEGVKFRDTPGWFTDKPYTVGNTIFYPKGAVKNWDEGQWMDPGSDELMSYHAQKEKGVLYDTLGDMIAGEEVPHVSQYRNKGLLGFLKDFGLEVAKHGHDSLYQDPESMEGFHYMDLPQKKALYEDVAGEYPFTQYNVDGRWD